jgi:IMP dehydrogenase
MSLKLMFNRHEIAERGRGLTFDDVLLVPTRSDVRSRRDPQLRSPLSKGLELDLPFLSANMDTVTESTMAIAMADLGAAGILHRFMPAAMQKEEVRLCLQAHPKAPVLASIGVTDEDRERARYLVDAGVKGLTIDIAHGHSIQMLETLRWLKQTFPKVQVIAGNVATAQATRDLIEAGADAVKVGIGPGSMCTTRIITGCGVPQLTAIAICSIEAERHQVPVIADGGMRTSGDIVKAFAAGASSVMLGSLLAGTIETPGEIKSGKKQYRGMASKAAQISWRGGVPEGMAAEGEATSVSVKGHARDVITELAGGVRSGMSYLNATSIRDISQNALFMEMGGAGLRESRAHGL